jgi:hypothetical protein
LLVKKQHVDEHTNAAVSPEQKDRMLESRINAKMLLVQKQSSGLVAKMGPSWFAALEAEFSKPYFLKVIPCISFAFLGI